MGNRVLLGKGTTARGSSDYGLWISKSGQDVLTDGDDDLIFNSELNDTTTGISTKNGECIGVKYKGYTEVTTDGNGSNSSFLIKSWPESDFTITILASSTVYAPLCLAQIGKTTGAASTQMGNGSFFVTTANTTDHGLLTRVYPENRDSDGSYNASGTYGALYGQVSALSANATYRVYYAICSIVISQ